ncbi:BREX-2 system phosphatase PglZ [Saccharopolyspora pogona]|uniref:BREX-2 system phosphatase PglZ n=1 Tax=Saccharopolyspora pogona TaxID=333966 RepID=UPI001686417E|nr:BREX-2 system phosphatase PglZ [Saccharopolyspora pogona]
MSKTVGTSAVRLTTATVMQYLAAQSKLESGKRRVVLLRAEPIWEEASELGWSDRCARIATAVSPLAVYELVLSHLAPEADGPEVLVVLTDREESELGADALARVHKGRVNAVDIWEVVRTVFGAQGMDQRLFAENWAAEALLDAAPPGGWPRLAGGPLARRHALGSLALRRLGAGPYDPDQQHRFPAGLAGGVELDANTLLRWSLSPGGPDRFLALRAPERAGLTRFLGEAEQGGQTGKALLALVTAGHGPDAVAFGLVCAALWVHAKDSADAEDYRARGRAERWFGEDPPGHGEALDALAEALGRASEEFVTSLLVTGRSGGEDADPARRLSAAVLDRASSLTRQFGAERAANASPVLPAGLDAAFVAVGRALENGDTERIARAVQELDRHQLATDHAYTRIERARMAQRITQWLAAEPVTKSGTVTDGIDRHLAETSWVDLALEHIEADSEAVPELKTAYEGLCTAVRARRREIDRNFVHALKTRTDGGIEDTVLTTESFLTRVVRPVIKAGERGVLLAVVSGMTAAIAARLGEELRRDWAEYDPLPGANDFPRRRGMAAEPPMITAISRLGDPRLTIFGKDDLWEERPGGVFKTAAYKAMADDQAHVGVVLNAVDDDLGYELVDGGWRLSNAESPCAITGLRELLQLAAERGRAVLLVGDHEISYRGDTSLAEFAIPLLALLPFGAAPPRGWRELGRQQPWWWSPGVDTAQQSTANTSASSSVSQKWATKKRRSEAESSNVALFDVALVPDSKESLFSAQPVSPADALVDELLTSDLFQAQLQSLARKPDLVKVEKALRALLDAGGTLPVTALAQRIGLPTGRADGFSAVLRQLVNFDGVQALETLPDGRTLRLNMSLVRDQFELRPTV